MIYESTINTIINELCWSPCIFAGLALALLIWQTIRFVKMMRSEKRALRFSRAALHGLPILVVLILICVLGSVLRHGIFLPFEKDADAICITGTVEAAERDPLSPRLFLRYSDERTYSYGSSVTVGGEVFYCLTDRDLSPGDVIEISYLPKSRIILRCSRTELGGS